MKQFSKGCSWKPIYVAGASSYLFACALFIAALWPIRAEGQILQCVEYDKIVKNLAAVYGEKLRSEEHTSELQSR